MSVQYDEGSMQIECDNRGCGETGDLFSRHEFHDMVEVAKRRGWKFENRRGQWFHTCPSCCAEDEFEAVD